MLDEFWSAVQRLPERLPDIATHSMIESAAESSNSSQGIGNRVESVSHVMLLEAELIEFTSV